MSDPTTPQCACPCEPEETFILPISGLSLNVNKSALPASGPSFDDVARMIDEALQDFTGGGSIGGNQWESDWFTIAASSTCTFQHNLGIEAPWRCNPRAVLRVETAAVGWKVGDIVFGDGSNYFVSNSAGGEIGWAINVSENDAFITFGDSVIIIANAKTGGKGGLLKANVKCKLVIDY